MDIAHITYKEKKYPVRISYYVLKMLRLETGKNIEDAEKHISIYENMLWHALVAGANFTGTTLDLEKEEMQWVLDACFNEFIAAIGVFFPAADADAKKKITKK